MGRVRVTMVWGGFIHFFTELYFHVVLNLETLTLADT